MQVIFYLLSISVHAHKILFTCGIFYHLMYLLSVVCKHTRLFSHVEYFTFILFGNKLGAVEHNVQKIYLEDRSVLLSV